MGKRQEGSTGGSERNARMWTPDIFFLRPSEQFQLFASDHPRHAVSVRGLMVRSGVPGHFSGQDCFSVLHTDTGITTGTTIVGVDGHGEQGSAIAYRIAGDLINSVERALLTRDAQTPLHETIEAAITETSVLLGSIADGNGAAVAIARITAPSNRRGATDIITVVPSDTEVLMVRGDTITQTPEPRVINAAWAQRELVLRGGRMITDEWGRQRVLLGDGRSYGIAQSIGDNDAFPISHRDRPIAQGDTSTNRLEKGDFNLMVTDGIREIPYGVEVLAALVRHRFDILKAQKNKRTLRGLTDGIQKSFQNMGVRPQDTANLMMIVMAAIQTSDLSHHSNAIDQALLVFKDYTLARSNNLVPDDISAFVITQGS